MDQSRALNALTPFLALAKSAKSPRAAADLIKQATSAPNTYVFAELLQQPNIQSIAGHEQYGSSFTLLQTFAWGTWESYKNNPNLPPLSDAQSLKLRLLSLLSIASEESQASSSSSTTKLSYPSLCQRLDLASPIDLEHLITNAIYHDLLSATLNPAAQTVSISSVAPLRDLAPGSAKAIVAELDAWRTRCDVVLADLETEIKRIHASAERRAKRDAMAERQVKFAHEQNDKSGPGSGTMRGGGSGRNAAGKRESVDVHDDDDLMDVDGTGLSTGGGGGGKKRGGAGGGSGLLSRAGKSAGR